jgi:hypothetical protein
MRKAILMMLLAAISHSATAEWIDAGHNSDFTAYTDPSTVHRSGDRIRMLSLVDHKAAMEKAGRTFFSVKAEHEYDCKKAQARILFSSAHSGNMGKGTIVFSNYSPGIFEPVLPRSIVAALWSAACSGNPPVRQERHATAVR